MSDRAPKAEVNPADQIEFKNVKKGMKVTLARDYPRGREGKGGIDGLKEIRGVEVVYVTDTYFIVNRTLDGDGKGDEIGGVNIWKHETTTDPHSQYQWRIYKA